MNHTKPDPYASEADTLAVIRPDTRSAAQKKLDAMLDARGAFEQGAEAYPILYKIAVELLEPDDNDFPLGKACDLSGEGTCEACQ